MAKSLNFPLCLGLPCCSVLEWELGWCFGGAAEPSSHFYHPPFGSPETPEAASLALQYSFFHWGLHPWAMYAMVALCLAYFQFRKQEPGLISASCQLLIQGQTRRSVGHAIDIIAVFATVFGVATSLGFGRSRSVAAYPTCLKSPIPS